MQKTYKIKKLTFIKVKEELACADTVLGTYILSKSIAGYEVSFSAKGQETTHIDRNIDVALAIDSANEHFEKNIELCLEEVKKNTVSFDIVDHKNSWIANKSEMDSSIERLTRETGKRITQNQVVDAIKSFTADRLSEGSQFMSISEFKRYFYNVAKKKLNQTVIHPISNRPPQK